MPRKHWHRPARFLGFLSIAFFSTAVCCNGYEAATYTWIAAAGNWLTQGNWSASPLSSQPDCNPYPGATAFDEAIINNGAAVTLPSPMLTSLKKLEVSGAGSELHLTGGARSMLVLTENGQVVVGSGGKINFLGGDPDGGSIRLSAVSIDVQSGGKITANGFGFSGAAAPGNGTGLAGGEGGSTGGEYGAGGGLGGAGGDGSPSLSGGGTYGSVTAPLDPGSGGGASDNGGSNVGGAGGGRLSLEANELTVSGEITADGVAGGDNEGGGAGGSIFITTQVLGGAGQIHARGGNAGPLLAAPPDTSGGGGGGGRVAIFASVDDFTGTVDASGGAALTGHQGANGAVLTKLASGLITPINPAEGSNVGNGELDWLELDLPTGGSYRVYVDDDAHLGQGEPSALRPEEGEAMRVVDVTDPHATVDGLSQSIVYYWQVTALDANGVVIAGSRLSRFSTGGDMTAPDAGFVLDGKTGEDIDFQLSQTTLSAVITEFVEADVGGVNPNACYWAIGTAPGKADVMDFTNFTPAPEPSTSPTIVARLTRTGLTLDPNATYYVTVRATNYYNGVTQVSSDGVSILKNLGQVCEGNQQCQSGFCAGYVAAAEAGEGTPGICCNTACSGGCEACSILTGSEADGSCMVKRSGTVCRAEANVCDIAEVCDGASTECPVDGAKEDGASVSGGKCSGGGFVIDRSGCRCDGGVSLVGMAGWLLTLAAWRRRRIS